MVFHLNFETLLNVQAFQENTLISYFYLESLVVFGLSSHKIFLKFLWISLISSR